MSNVETFKYYASQLNLTKPQLEAVTDCFKACFEADANRDVEPSVTNMTKDVDVAKKHVPFDDTDANFAHEDMQRLSANLPSWMKGKKGYKTGTELGDNITHHLNSVAAQAAAGNQNAVQHQLGQMKKDMDYAARREQAKRQRIMEQQKALNQALGINLTVDGVMGPKTRAAMKQYETMKAAAQNQQPAPQEKQVSVNQTAQAPNIDWNKFHQAQAAGHGAKT
jgi:hypothetical protein